jgi:phosphatidyl-myo-inositol alpha-mannosyltransferase
VRVGMFSPYSLTVHGGVQDQVLGLARALRKHGLNVRVLGPCDGPPPEPGVTPLGNAIPVDANGSVAPIAPDPAATLRTIRALRDERFDVIHLHEPLVPGPNQTALITKYAPIVGTFHAAGVSASYRWLRLPLKKISKAIDIRCAVSDDALALAERVMEGSCELLFNGVEVERFRDAEPWPYDGPPAIFFVGRHEERKGLRVLLEAHKHLTLETELWVASTGPLTDELKAQYRDPRIKWLGRISNAEKARRWAAASVYCAPSLGGESFGVVLLESMAAGTPVVASSIDGYRNVATDGIDALLVRPNDPIALAKALHRVLSEPSVSEQLALSGSQTATRYSMDSLARAYIERYERLAK